MSFVRAEDLLELAKAYAPFRYGAPASYPWPLPGVQVRVAPSATADLRTNCVCFAEGLLVEAFRRARQRIGRTLDWDVAAHRAFMIMTDDRFGNIHAAIEHGLGDPLPDDQIPGRWRLVQGWSEDRMRGHCFIVVDYTDDDRVLILESNNSGDTVRGVGYRGLGHIRDFDQPPPAPASWTWSMVRERYPDMRACKLRVLS